MLQPRSRRWQRRNRWLAAVRVDLPGPIVDQRNDLRERVGVAQRVDGRVDMNVAETKRVEILMGDDVALQLGGRTKPGRAQVGVRRSPTHGGPGEGGLGIGAFAAGS